MDKTFDEAIAGIRKAERGVEVREDIAQGMEYVKQYAEEVTGQQQAALQALRPPPEQPAPRRKRPQQLQRAKAPPGPPPTKQPKAHSQRPQTQRAREALPLLLKLKRTGLRPSYAPTRR